MSELETQLCPWCHTEIVWDEEIGPEKHCPHCGNELTGYRTVQLGIDTDEDEGEEEGEEADDNAMWEDDDEEASRGAEGRDLTDLSSYDRRQLVLDRVTERIIDDQLEAPECPSCRQFMLEAGTQIVTGPQFRERVPAALGVPLLSPPLELVLYVCPACFHTESRLGAADQQRLQRLLAAAGDD